MDASKGFIKDGNQNPLREQDIHKIVDTFNHYIETQETKSFIFQHSEFTSFGKQMDAVFNQWASQTTAFTTALDKGLKPKNAIHTISENLLQHYANKPLTDSYAMYQHLMDYWAKTMQDDFYELAADGWIAGNSVSRMEKKIKNKSKKAVKLVAGIEGLEGRFIPPALMIQEYFSPEQKAINELQARAESLTTGMDELREEHGGEEGLLVNAMDDKSKISKVNLSKVVKESGKRNTDNAEEYDMLQQYKKLMEDEKKVQVKIKTAKVDLETKVIAQYPKLSIDEIKTIVVEKKWIHSLKLLIRNEMDNISYRLTQRIKELAERYETPLPKLSKEVDELESKVSGHLEKMGFRI